MPIDPTITNIIPSAKKLIVGTKRYLQCQNISEIDHPYHTEELSKKRRNSQDDCKQDSFENVDI